MKTGIIGAGISGLATAQAILAGDSQAEVVIFEAAPNTGGKVLTEVTEEGYLCEWGVNAFLDKSPRTLELCKEVGLTPVSADAAAKKRYVYSEGELHQLPEKPPQFLFSNLLSVPGRLRVMGEVFTGKTDRHDETLAEFGTRHLGREAFEKLIDPMASGVFAGDATTMSLKSCFPRIHEVESEHGSLIRGLIKLQKAARKEGKKDTPGPGPGGLLTSFNGGMSVLTDALTAGLGDRVHVNSPVDGVSRNGGLYTAHLGDGSSEDFDNLVLATPAYAQERMLRDMAPGISELVGGIQYPSLAVVCLGYSEAEAGHCLDGFGFLVPSRENRDILGSVVDSNLFSDRAPEGSVLFRTLVGGARKPQLAGLPDEKLLDMVRANLKEIMGLNAEPAFASIYRHEKAIPQYLVGHADRLAAIDRQLETFPGLVMSGNAFRGVSLNDCVLNASKTAEFLAGRERAGPA
ncbi:MAG: protoporphyrinogen oxidase [Xanthomonadales bacterium]|nr:protoporphyrinogen oxidase [Gammaproteobacteria bacterium]MBT8052462.1 protoporphyrinogen oxidase [Gammaproteobacteria bacterium]NND57164.1 protoporphyrinogen oxidase [Xanthomonadales bacterium]NNK52814.1 protoporphyrinogen oxidase [Xanthomonadales bacterium]